MGLLDSLLGQVLGGAQSGAPGGGDNNAALLQSVLAMLGNDAPGGGLNALVAGFQRGGLGDVMSSWIGGGPNKPVDPGALSNVLGPDVIGQFARQAGIGHGDASSVLAQLLPEVVNHMTPQGQVPHGNDLEGAIGSLLGQLGSR